MHCRLRGSRGPPSYNSGRPTASRMLRDGRFPVGHWWIQGAGRPATRFRRRCGLYLMRCGLTASSPGGVSCPLPGQQKLPSHQTTAESPSNARMWVAMRSRTSGRARSYTAQPGKAEQAPLRAPAVLRRRGRWSVRRAASTLPPDLSSLARCTRLRSPPDRSPTFFC